MYYSLDFKIMCLYEMYQVPNISHGVSFLMVLDSLITALCRDIEILTFWSLSLVLMMTMKTMIKRGAVKARTGMRTQDPRLAQHCDLGSAFTELAAKGRRKARLLSARDALQSDPSSQKRGRTMAPSGGRLGAKAPSRQSRRTRGSPSAPTTTTCWTRYSLG